MRLYRVMLVIVELLDVCALIYTIYAFWRIRDAAIERTTSIYIEKLLL